MGKCSVDDEHGRVSDALFLECCRKDEGFRKMVLGVFQDMQGQDSNLSLSSANNQG